jgi:hypothetical protein
MVSFGYSASLVRIVVVSSGEPDKVSSSSTMYARKSLTDFLHSLSTAGSENSSDIAPLMRINL